MATDPITAIIPAYMRDFHCIAQECEEDCCKGLKVCIDEARCSRYCRVREPELRDLFAKYLVSAGEGTTRIELANGHCPFFTPQRLCAIQLKLGEAYLPEVCYRFPRIINRIGETIEISASMSCPEAARLGLLNKDGIRFVETELDSEILQKSGFSDHRLSDALTALFWDLRTFSIRVLKSRDYALWERLIALGIFFEQASDLFKAGRFTEVLALMVDVENQMAKGDLKDPLNRIQSLPGIQLSLLAGIIRLRIDSEASSITPAYRQLMREAFAGLHLNGGPDVPEAAVRSFQEAVARYYAPFMAEQEHILENYLVNYVFSLLFPIAKERLFDNYIELVLQYALIQMHLIGLAAFYRERFTTDTVIRLVSAFCRSTAHSADFFDDARTRLEAAGYASPAYMAILIKTG